MKRVNDRIFYSLNEFAQEAKLSPSTVRKRITQGSIKATMVAGKEMIDQNQLIQD
ncbi:MAG: hypothetical protein K0U41_05575 [Gammaproteobacteria bacterium]|nr:hypothetical protein [Gammaproteobacteria bacterium]